MIKIGRGWQTDSLVLVPALVLVLALVLALAHTGTGTDTGKDDPSYAPTSHSSPEESKRHRQFSGPSQSRGNELLIQD